MASGDAENLTQDRVDAVDQETRIVFTNFVVEKIERDDPSHTDIITSSGLCRAENRNIAEVGRQLARIADDINERYRQQFEQIANHLDMSSDNVYENFSQIIQSMLRQETNISRILTLFCFGYYLARRFLESSSFLQFFNRIQNCVIQFVRNNIAQWIISQGGWLQIVGSNEGNYIFKFSIMAGICALLLGIYYIKRRS